MSFAFISYCTPFTCFRHLSARICFVCDCYNNNTMNESKKSVLSIITVSLWILLSVLLNVELKSFFSQHNIPFIVTFANLLVASYAGSSIIGKGVFLEKGSNISQKYFVAAMFHFLGTLSTNFCINVMTISFTQTIKVSEICLLQVYCLLILIICRQVSRFLQFFGLYFYHGVAFIHTVAPF